MLRRGAIRYGWNFSKGGGCLAIFFRGDLFRISATPMKVEKVWLRSLGFLKAVSKSPLKVPRFLRLGDDLITPMYENCLLTDKLTKIYKLVYWEERSSWGWEYLLPKQRMWEIQAREMIIKEGLDWWPIDRTSRDVISPNTFLKIFLGPCVLFVVKSFYAGRLSRLNEEKCLYIKPLELTSGPGSFWARWEVAHPISSENTDHV